MVFARQKVLFYLSTFILLSVVAFSGIPDAWAQCPNFTLPPPICAGGNCGPGTPITVSGDTTGITQYEWIIKGGVTDTIRGKAPIYSFKDPGRYEITLRVTRRNGNVETCSPSQIVDVQGLNEFTIGPDENLGPQEEEICKGTPITLRAQFQQGGPPTGATYLWSNRQTTETITVDTAGCYSVTITDATGCSRTNKVKVKVYKPDPNDPEPPKEESRWYFGARSGIRFVGGQPQAITGNANTPEGTSGISDASGKFLFYTDGRNVFDKDGNPMKDRDNKNVTVAERNALNGGPNSTQAVLIVAQPGCNDCEPVYYVFTTTDIGSGGSELEYSIVDMRLNGGLGQVTQKNVLLSRSSTERLAAIRAVPDTANPDRPETTWIVTHDFNSSNFSVYPLTTRGVGAPQRYSVGEIHGSSTAKGEGYLKVYRNKVAIVIPGGGSEQNIVQVFNFNNATGVISGPPNTIRLGATPPRAYGVEIVGDSTLYVSLSGGTDSRILGYNLGSGVDATIQNSQRIIYPSAAFPATGFTIGALQLDPNGRRLFVAQQGKSSLGEITNAQTLAAAEFNGNAVPLTALSGLGLPNSAQPDNDGNGQGFRFEPPPCTPEGATATIRFQAQPDRAGGDPQKSAYQWRFSGANTTGQTFNQELARAGFGVNQTVSVNFSGPGSYTATLTIYNDCTDLNVSGGARPETFTQQVIVPLQPPRPTLRDISVCTGTPLILDAYQGLSGPGPTGVTYTWTTPAGPVVGRTIQVPVPQPGQVPQPVRYTVEVSNTEGCRVTGSALVTFTNAEVNLGQDITLCGSSTLLLNAGNPGSEYEWFEILPGNPNPRPIGTRTSQTISVTPTVTTQYRVRVTTPTGCVATDEILVSVNSQPRITPVVRNANSCDDSSPAGFGSISLDVSNDPNAGTYNYRWLKDGSDVQGTVPTTTIYLGASPGIYQIQVFTRSGCDTTFTVAVGNDSQDAVQFNANIPTPNCETGSITLRRAGNASGRPSITEYRLTDENGQPPRNANGVAIPRTFVVGEDIPVDITFSGLLPGIYRFEGKNAINCPFSFVYEIKLPPKPNVQGNATVTGCGQAQLAVTGQLANMTFQWSLQGGSNIPTNPDGTATATQSGTYVLKATSTLPPGCITRNTVPVTLPTAGTAAIIPANPACEGNEILLRAVETLDFDTYTWVRPDGTQVNSTSLTATTAGEYQMIARNSLTGCSSTARITPSFIPLPPAPVVTEVPVICAGSPVPTLVASGQNLRWYANRNKTNPLGNSPDFRPPINTRRPGQTTYYVTQSTTGWCESPVTPVTVIVIPAPVVNLGPNREVCTGQPVELNAAVTIPGATYRWNTGQNTPKLTVTRTGTYSVQVNAGTCTVNDTILVTFLPVPTINIQRREVPLCLIDGQATATLDAGPGSNYTYEWRQAGSNDLRGQDRTLTVTDLGAYTVTVRDGSGICPATETVQVVNKCEPRVFIPDAFTPNADGKNDALEVFHAYVGNFKMQVFNRWGEVIFVSESPEAQWDGTYLGEKVPPGTYTWKVVYTSQFYPERPPVELRGGLLLIR